LLTHESSKEKLPENRNVTLGIQGFFLFNSLSLREPQLIKEKFLLNLRAWPKRRNLM